MRLLLKNARAWRSSIGRRRADDRPRQPHRDWPATLPAAPLSGAPREVAYPILWLASDKASYVTAAAIMADGGGLTSQACAIGAIQMR